MNNDYSGPQYGQNVAVKAVQPNENYSQSANAEAVKGSGAVFKKYGLLSLIFGILYTFCLYKNHSGITYPFFMLGALTILYFIRKKDGLSLLASKNGNKGLGLFYIVSLMLLSIHKCLSGSGLLIVLDGIAIFLLYYSFVINLYLDTTNWDIAAWFEGMLFTAMAPFSAFLNPLYDCADWFKNKNGNLTKEKKQTISAAIIGAVCAVPMLIIVILLLSSADAVFSRMMEKIYESIHLPDNVWDILWIEVTFVISAFLAYLVPYVLQAGEVKVKGEKHGNNNPVIAITFTGMMGFVYLVFCLIQFMFLFTKTMSLPAGYTYAKYAREGFYQLLAVCLINIVMVSVCTRAFRKSRVLTAILTVIAACTYIMIASSTMRMLLYIKVYNLTFMRVFVLWFLAVLCFWLAFLMVDLFRERFPVFKACMIVITVAYIGFIYTNPEYQIAKYDLKAVEGGRVEQYQSVEDYIVNELSTDAVPALVGHSKLLHKYELYLIDEERFDDINHDSIRTFNLSNYRAKKIFK